MLRAIVVLAVLGMSSIAMAQIVVGEDEKLETMRHNPSYDNLYRPGNAIWRLRMLRMGLTPAINDVNQGMNSTMSNISVESSAMVAEPLRIYKTKDIISLETENYQDLQKLINETGRRPGASIEEDGGFLSVRDGKKVIEIHQINPNGKDVQLAAKGEIIIKVCVAKAPVSPIALKAAK